MVNEAKGGELAAVEHTDKFAGRPLRYGYTYDEKHRVDSRTTSVGFNWSGIEYNEVNGWLKNGNFVSGVAPSYTEYTVDGRDNRWAFEPGGGGNHINGFDQLTSRWVPNQWFGISGFTVPGTGVLGKTGSGDKKEIDCWHGWR